MQQLTAYGWNEHFAALLEPGESIEAVGRVVQEHKEAYLVHAAGARLGNIWAEISGKMRHEGTVRSDFPAVGDWVMLRGLEHVPADRNPDDVGEHGPVQIFRIFPRRTVLSRRLEAGDDQVLAVNVDIAFLGASLNENFNLRRLERYLTLSQNAGVKPVVLLTKADLCKDAAALIDQVVALGADIGNIHAISVISGQGMDDVRRYLHPGITAVILGSSGIGKSTLVNYLAEADIQDMMEARDFDAKGRHCTTFRHLIRTAPGGLLIDTPGLRGLAMGEATDALVAAFADIESLAASCRFTDCRHESEPGCSIRAALEAGKLDSARLDGYLKLQREMASAARRENRIADRKQKKMDKRVTATREKRGGRNWEKH
jgi:ribosome biogenesis GTPase / thiamine phosphate phosphatase